MISRLKWQKIIDCCFFFFEKKNKVVGEGERRNGQKEKKVEIRVLEQPQDFFNILLGKQGSIKHIKNEHNYLSVCNS
jgi:hypothetical protein